MFFFIPCCIQCNHINEKPHKHYCEQREIVYETKIEKYTQRDPSIRGIYTCDKWLGTFAQKLMLHRAHLNTLCISCYLAADQYGWDKIAFVEKKSGV